MFGERVRKRREDAGLTQAELGKLIGVSDRVVGYYEANVRFPKKPETLQKLSEVFHISIDSLISNDEDSMQSSVRQNRYSASMEALELLNGVRLLFAGGKLPQEDQDEFFRLITEMYFEAKKSSKK